MNISKPRLRHKLPDTEWNSERICSLPLFPDMTESDFDRVITALHQIAGQ
ncbi:DegT/DnrJ/EryC1/StrS family aminotransferase [Salmonella enterica subsp. enterica serovar Enteritidis]|nr:hypothetical protein [Salmonella enterica subsp. enterica serovar Enteritidis]EEN5291680.1 hypothetical protein [Salmonella enterica subsp. enterica serovar Enteritidis]EIE2654480.1 DegT/DnrJ/EryC1/StrS family aminotransferase [Salmonella enterica subsp. enterica serovar Enteritidis]